MCILLMRTTGLVRVGKGRRQHNYVQVVFDTADVICTVQGAHGVCALRAIVIIILFQPLVYCRHLLVSSLMKTARVNYGSW